MLGVNFQVKNAICLHPARLLQTRYRDIRGCAAKMCRFSALNPKTWVSFFMNCESLVCFCVKIARNGYFFFGKIPEIWVLNFGKITPEHGCVFLADGGTSPTNPNLSTLPPHTHKASFEFGSFSPS